MSVCSNWPSRAIFALLFMAMQILVGVPAAEKKLILQFIGAHREPGLTWTAARHWQVCGPACCRGQSCGCCRAANEKDYPTGCSCCLNLYNFGCTCHEARARLRMYNGQY